MARTAHYYFPDAQTLKLIEWGVWRVRRWGVLFVKCLVVFCWGIKAKLHYKKNCWYAKKKVTEIAAARQPLFFFSYKSTFFFYFIFLNRSLFYDPRIVSHSTRESVKKLLNLLFAGLFPSALPKHKKGATLEQQRPRCISLSSFIDSPCAQRLHKAADCIYVSIYGTILIVLTERKKKSNLE